MKSNIQCIIFAGIFLFYSCNKDTVVPIEGEWQQGNPVLGYAPQGALLFSVNNKAYVGLGESNHLGYNNIYQIDPIGARIGITVFPGGRRTYASSFTIDDNVYMGLGFRSTILDPETGFEPKLWYTDFYSYSFDSDSWTRLADFPGEGRTGAIAFSIDGVGYIGGGSGENNELFTDFYRYDPADGWTELGNFANGLRVEGCNVFVWQGEAYLCFGRDLHTNKLFRGMMKYSPQTNRWSNVPTDINTNNSLARSLASCFTLEKAGKTWIYFISGEEETGEALTSCWKYSPADNRWVQVCDLPVPIRGGSGFTLQGKGYIINGLYERRDDVWVYSIPDNV